ncbi:hypothetical protein H257_14235 [Aphanomyces astaci]|uniref:Uncharacterized protein n=1 Tax=Aphanomyces astaci TaxID=112090 RepID=W4FU74_APHAT|nr:hypothetical protein H257_14235 [Aphanomyces astaci]ETV70203.1 hypothetical protein H257_14235 [Aphanomyces astaci]|eukprot:XP_009840299.1 hypothetical protein H257_14235 [Aphanomyces astaci]
MTKAQLLEQVQLLQQQQSHQPPQLQGDNDVAATTTPKKRISTKPSTSSIASSMATSLVSVDSLKNKLRKLRSEFVAIQRSLTPTDNDELSTPPKPSYYSEILVAFANLHGLGDIEFGMERTPSASPVAEDDVEVEIDLEMQRQRQMRKNQIPDLAAGLNNLGEALASRLIEEAKVKNSRSSDVDMSEQMTKLLDLMEETKASIDKTNDVNDKMLQFLQGKF